MPGGGGSHQSPVPSRSQLKPGASPPALSSCAEVYPDFSPRRPVVSSSPRRSSHRGGGGNRGEESSPPGGSSSPHQRSMNASGGFFFGRSATTGGSVRTPLNLVALSSRESGGGGPHSSRHRGGPPSASRVGSSTAPHGDRHYFPAPAGILPELAAPQTSSRGHHMIGRGHPSHQRGGRLAGGRGFGGGGGPKGGSLVPSPPPASLNLINSVAGDALLFSETNMDWTKLNIFRTRLCDRLTQTHNCHMANRCLFSHDVNWPRRTPFLPRATALTLRYIPVWCPRLSWPPLIGYCDSSGKISWTSSEENWNARLCHQKCTRGDNCPFVHNVEEFLYHPEVYKTRSCCLANDDNFEEQMNSHCVALCPWYFCPFAHDMYELRNLREARFAWHAPPQIVDDDHVARTQDFDDLEKRIIEFVRRSPHGSLDLYASPDSPLTRCWRERMPPVIRPLVGSSLEQLTPSLGHRHSRFDDLLHLMVVASFLNLLLYPVENFYVPTLLSLQCAVLQSQLGLTGATTIFDCATLLCRFAEASTTAHEIESQSEHLADTAASSPRLTTTDDSPSELPIDFSQNAQVYSSPHGLQSPSRDDRFSLGGHISGSPDVTSALSPRRALPPPLQLVARSDSSEMAKPSGRGSASWRGSTPRALGSARKQSDSDHEHLTPTHTSPGGADTDVSGSPTTGGAVVDSDGPVEPVTVPRQQDEDDLKAILELLNSTKAEDLLQMMALFQDAAAAPVEEDPSSSTTSFL